MNSGLYERPGARLTAWAAACAIWLFLPYHKMLERITRVQPE